MTMSALPHHSFGHIAVYIMECGDLRVVDKAEAEADDLPKLYCQDITQ